VERAAGEPVFGGMIVMIFPCLFIFGVGPGFWKPGGSVCVFFSMYVQHDRIGAMAPLPFKRRRSCSPVSPCVMFCISKHMRSCFNPARPALSSKTLGSLIYAFDRVTALCCSAKCALINTSMVKIVIHVHYICIFPLTTQLSRVRVGVHYRGLMLHQR
jgi:hypothetical protein